MSDAASEPRDPPAPSPTTSERLAALEAERRAVAQAFEWPVSAADLPERARSLMRLIHRTADQQLQIRKALERAGYKCEGSWPDGAEVAQTKPGADFAPWQEAAGVDKLVDKITLLEGAAATSDQRATEQQERAAAACERANAAEARATEAAASGQAASMAAAASEQRARALADQLQAAQVAQGIAERSYDALQRSREASRVAAAEALEHLQAVRQELDDAGVLPQEDDQSKRVAALLEAGKTHEKVHEELRAEADRRTDVANKEIERANRLAERCQAAEQALQAAQRDAGAERRRAALLEEAVREKDLACEQLNATIAAQAANVKALEDKLLGAAATMKATAESVDDTLESRVAALEQAIVRLAGRG